MLVWRFPYLWVSCLVSLFARRHIPGLAGFRVLPVPSRFKSRCAPPFLFLKGVKNKPRHILLAAAGMLAVTAGGQPLQTAAAQDVPVPCGSSGRRVHDIATFPTLRIATYNVENLFDTINDPGVQETVLTPAQYTLKTGNIARVVGDLAPDALGLCEIENDRVLRDLIAAPALAGIPYQSITYPSRDARGITVGFVYRTDRLQVLGSEPIRVTGTGKATRDILKVEAVVTHPALPADHEPQPVIFYVMHLPSQLGGASAARERRRIFSQLMARAGADMQRNPAGIIVAMGDMNCNPDVILRLKPSIDPFICTTLGPWRRGQGSYAYGDTWNMYDNILYFQPNPSLSPRPQGWHRLAPDARVFVQPCLLNAEGPYRGYPNRYYFSDHLPVFLDLVCPR